MCYILEDVVTEISFFLYLIISPSPLETHCEKEHTFEKNSFMYFYKRLWDVFLFMQIGSTYSSVNVFFRELFIIHEQN